MVSSFAESSFSCFVLQLAKLHQLSMQRGLSPIAQPVSTIMPGMCAVIQVCVCLDCSPSLQQSLPFFSPSVRKLGCLTCSTGAGSKGSLLLAAPIRSFYWLAGRRRDFIAPLYLPVGERNYYVQWCVLQSQRPGSQKRMSVMLNISSLKWKWTPLLYLAVFCWKGFPSTSERVWTALLNKEAEFWFKICDVSILIHSVPVFSLIRDGRNFSDIPGASYSQWRKKNLLATPRSDLILYPYSAAANDKCWKPCGQLTNYAH